MLGYSSLSIRNIRRTSQVVWVVKIQIFLYYSIIYEAIPCFYRLWCDGVSILHWWTWHIAWLIELRWSWPAFGRFLVLADILPSKARVRLSCPFRAGISDSYILFIIKTTHLEHYPIILFYSLRGNIYYILSKRYLQHYKGYHKLGFYMIFHLFRIDNSKRKIL